ncbi:GGDEF domain-containing protein, partial [bacterium]
REEKEDLPLIDEFTGLYNRRGLLTIAHYQLKTAERLKRGMWMITVEIDNFDRIKKVLGANAGKKAILESADILRTTFRASDVIAYIDEYEFAIIAVGALKDSANALKNRLLQKVKARNSQAKSSYKLSISVGMAYFNPEKPCTVEDLLANARSNALMNE